MGKNCVRGLVSEVNWFYRVLMHGFVYATLVIESARAPSTNDL